MAVIFKGLKWQEVVEFIVLFSVANFIGLTLFAGMVFCLLECSAPWGAH